MYLGSTVQSNGECGKETEKRVQAVWNGWRKVSGVLCDRKISVRIKGKVYKTVFHHIVPPLKTIIPQHLIEKLSLLGTNTPLCNWILDFLTRRHQSVWIGNNISSITTLSTGAPQFCLLSPMLFTLLTHDCAAIHNSNHIIKFADDTTVVGLISKKDESERRCSS
ncbi:hypothetical protein QTP86_032949 [Hemibagrus guttatus]|nr:hypothetical protein QTP86_032949 [Hemibagrus guttatus]